MNQSYSLIRQRQQYALGYSTGQNDKDFYLQLFKIENLQIVRAYGINIQQHWANSCKNASNIKNWFDGTHDLVKYIKQGSQKMIRVWIEEGRIDILVQARKGKNKYVKIGQIQLQQVRVNKKMQLLWIIQQCNRSQCLNAQQIFYNVRNMYRIYMQFINMPETNKLQQQNEIYLEKMLDIIQNLQKSLDLVQEYFETQTKRILGEFNTKINSINTKLQNFQIKQNQTSTQKLQYQMNKRQENTQQSIDNEIKYDITSQQNMGNKDISSYVNTSAAKFKYFKANQYQISVMKNPTQYSLMLCGHPIQTQKFKYSIKIIIMKKKIALGIAKASSAHKTRCSKRQQMIIYSNKSHFTFETNKANQGKHFKVGDTVSVCVNFREGLICWIANETILFSQTIELLKNKQIVWMPYIEMVNQGDTIEWVPN